LIPFTSKTAAVSQVCFHCGSHCNNLKHAIEEKYFCCEGCKTVYEILSQYNLCGYYELNDHPGLKFNKKLWSNRFEFLDLEEIQNKLILFSDGNQIHVQFYIPQMHCSSCLWLLENIGKLQEGIIHSRVQFEDKTVFIVLDKKRCSLRRIVELLTALAYEPHLDLDQSATDPAIIYNKKRLVKLGVVGFCFANIMMMCLPEYLAGGMLPEKEIGWMFTFISLVLSIPVILYSASEFFINAWTSVKSKYINIDLPIALAILLTFARSIYEIQSGAGNGYLDSMSGIVFFMLAGRYVQDRTNKSLSYNRDYKSFFPVAVHLWNGDKFIPCSIEKIKTDDLILIHNEEIIPCDGICIEGNPELDYSFVGGESNIVKVNIQDKIYAGAKQTGGNIKIRVLKPVSHSYLTGLWNKEIFQTKKPRYNSDIDKLGRQFTLVVLILAGCVATYWYFQGQTQLMWNSLTTILIVACPCAVLLASSYTNSRVLSLLSLNKLYVRHAGVLELIADIRTIVFDKTGTLTFNRSNRLEYYGIDLSAGQRNRIYTVAHQSMHPLSQSLAHYLNDCHPRRVHYFKQIPGQGSEALIDDHELKIGSDLFLQIPEIPGGSCIHIKEDGKYLGYFQIQQQFRNRLKETLRKLSAKYSLSIITGDDSGNIQQMEFLLPEHCRVQYNCDPLKKLNYIEQLQTIAPNGTMMIGDGLNDAAALKQSDVGIAVTENKNNFTPACDAILDASSFEKIPDLLQFIKDSRRAIRIIFIYSIAYNLIGAYFALRGVLSPVIAAILMPISSVSIILLSFGITAWYARKNGLQRN
jgi:Cu+-exporting ATPase